MKAIQKKYLPEFVYGGIDGTITTFAIISGAIGGGLSGSVILILGFANLFADGFSMAVSNYLSTKSQKKLLEGQTHEHIHMKSPWKTAFATFLSFFILGLIPLLPFVFGIGYDAKSSGEVVNHSFHISIILTIIVFIVIGAVRGAVTEDNKLKTSIVTLLIGALAAAIAFGVGNFLQSIV